MVGRRTRLLDSLYRLAALAPGCPLLGSAIGPICWGRCEHDRQIPQSKPIRRPRYDDLLKE
eukprot:1194880-Prorocentrum_minimum.AAC.1